MIGTVRQAGHVEQALAAGAHHVVNVAGLDAGAAARQILAVAPGGVDRVAEVAFDTGIAVDLEILKVPRGGPHPGGWWTAMFDRRQVTSLADNLVEHGYAVWNVEYRRLGEEGGGWPGTFEDAAAAIDAVAELDSTLDTSRVVVVGHSAGGHLAAWSAHRAALPVGAPGSEPKVRLAGAVSLAGVLDLVAADEARLGTVIADPNAEPPAGAPEPSWPEIWPKVAAGVHDGVVNLLLGGHADAAPDRYDLTSPAEMGDGKVPVLAMHGAADDGVPAALSRSYLEKATAKGVDVRLVEVPSAGHFDVIDPRQPSWANVRQWIADQVGRQESKEPR